MAGTSKSTFSLAELRETERKNQDHLAQQRKSDGNVETRKPPSGKDLLKDSTDKKAEEGEGRPGRGETVYARMPNREGEKSTERNVVPIRLSIILPLDMGGVTHHLVLTENISVDSVKVALWKEVPNLWQGPERQGYSLFLKKNREELAPEFKKILSFDALAKLYEAKKRIKLSLVPKGTIIVRPQGYKETKKDDEDTSPWKTEAKQLATQLSDTKETLYVMQKLLKEWQSSVIEGLSEEAYPPPSVEKRALLEIVKQKIQTVLDGKIDEGEGTESDSDEEFEVKDGQEFLPRRLNTSIFEIFGGAGPVVIERESSEKKMTPEQHLERIRNEIIETERSYVSGLDLLMNQYMKRLEADNLATARDISLIFSNINLIQQIHHDLLDDVQKTAAGDLQELSKCFAKFVPYLKLYTEYVNGFDKATQCLEKLEKDKRVKALFEELRNMPESGKLDLRSFLITPIQRLPRYELLLRDLLKRIPENRTEERELISKLLDTVISVNKYVNESKMQQDRRQRLYKLKSAVKPKGLDIFSRPDRRLVKEDTLPMHEVDPQSDEAAREQLNLGQLKFRQRYFFLFDDLLIEVRELKSGKYKFIHSFNLLRLTIKDKLDEASAGVTLTNDSEPTAETPKKQKAGDDKKSSEENGADAGSQLTFVLVEDRAGTAPEGSTARMVREYVIKVSSIEEREAWVKEINAACEFAKKAVKAIKNTDEDSLKAMAAAAPIEKSEATKPATPPAEKTPPARKRGFFGGASKKPSSKDTKKDDKKGKRKDNKDKETDKGKGGKGKK